MRFPIKARLASAFIAVLILTGTCAWLGISSLGAVEQRFQDTVTGPVPRIEAIGSVRYYMAQLSRIEKNIIIENDDKKKQAFVARIMTLRDGFQNAIKPWRATRIYSAARSVLELPAGALAGTQTVEGDVLRFQADVRAT